MDINFYALEKFMDDLQLRADRKGIAYDAYVSTILVFALYGVIGELEYIWKVVRDK